MIAAFSNAELRPWEMNKIHRWDAQDWWKAGATVYILYMPSESRVINSVFSPDTFIECVKVGPMIIGNISSNIMSWAKPPILKPGMQLEVTVRILKDGCGTVFLETKDYKRRKRKRAECPCCQANAANDQTR